MTASITRTSWTQKLSEAWSIPEMKDVPLDSPEATLVHRSIILRKPFLKRLYEIYYQVFLNTARDLAGLPGQMLELGSGGGFLKERMPDVVTSDVHPYPHLDLVAFGDHLPFESASLKAIFMLNVLHHIPEPEAFFREAERTLVRGGRVVMVEPFNSLFGRALYKNCHHEPFDETAPDWRVVSGGRLSGSNQAMPWIIFWRDGNRFKTLFPSLHVRTLKPHTVLCYALSGGMSWRAFVPAFSFPFFWGLDTLLSKARGLFPVFQTIELEKR